MSRLVAIHFDGDVTAEELRQALEPAGFVVRVEAGRMVASRVPAFLRRDPEPVKPSNVVPLVAPLSRAGNRPGARRA